MVMVPRNIKLSLKANIPACLCISLYNNARDFEPGTGICKGSYKMWVILNHVVKNSCLNGTTLSTSIVWLNCWLLAKYVIAIAVPKPPPNFSANYIYWTHFQSFLCKLFTYVAVVKGTKNIPIPQAWITLGQHSCQKEASKVNLPIWITAYDIKHNPSIKGR